MKNKIRICFLIGIILSTVAFAYFTISSFMGVIAVASIMTGGDSLGEAMVNMAGILTMGIMVIMIAFGVLGLIFSAVSFTRVKMEPEKFANKKGMPITVIVFDFIMIFLIFLTLFQEFDVLSFIFLLAFVAAAVLIIVDLARNKKLLNAEVNQSQQDAQKPSEESESNNFDSEK